MVAITLDMAGARIASQNGMVITLGERLEWDSTQFLTWAEHPSVVNGETYALHIQDGRGWMRAAGVYDLTNNTLTLAGDILTLTADGVVGSSLLTLSQNAYVTCTPRTADMASQAGLQEAVDQSAISASQASDAAIAAQAAAEAAETAAEAADPSNRILRAGDSMTGALNTKMATVASHATTAPIWAAAGNIIDFTGTATITDFPDAPQAGAQRVLLCAAACTFTHNSNIAVQGGRNFTAAAGDMVIVTAVTTATFRANILRANDLPIFGGTAGHVFTGNGTSADGSFQAIPNFRNIQFFTSSGTYTKPANIGRVWVKVIDGGDGGQALSGNGGRGGKGGDCAEGFVDIAGNVTVTIGAGGVAGIGGQNNGLGGAGSPSSFGSMTTASPGSMAVTRAGKTPGSPGGFGDNIGGAAGDGSNSYGKGGNGAQASPAAGAAGFVLVMY